MGHKKSTVMYGVIGILFVTKFVSSQNLNCTRLTTACPTAAQWSDRSNYFNCSGHKSYVCLMASNAELREGCIFDSKIPAKQTGCPYTKQCDNRTYQPLLVTENKYLRCPPDLSGCPPHNHSGYSILEIYKFPRCQGKNISEERTPHTVQTIPTARFTKGGVWITMVTCIELGVITLLLLIAVIIICRNKIKDGLKNLRAHQPSGDVDNGKSNANLENTDSQEVKHLRSSTDSSNDDSDRSHTPMKKTRCTSNHRNSSLSSETLRIQPRQLATTSPTEANLSTENSEGNSVCNTVLDTKNMARDLKNVRRMKEKT